MYTHQVEREGGVYILVFLFRITKQVLAIAGLQKRKQ